MAFVEGSVEGYVVVEETGFTGDGCEFQAEEREGEAGVCALGVESFREA